MNLYISNPENLKLMMNLLRDQSRNIQFEAFHVFKVCRVKFDNKVEHLISLYTPGVCCQPKQGKTNLGYPFEKQGQID